MGHIGQERAMEEILSSIKRVIAEGGEAGRQRRATAGEGTPTELPPAEEPEVLELTDSIDAQAPGGQDDDLARFDLGADADLPASADAWRDGTPVAEQEFAPEPVAEPEPPSDPVSAAPVQETAPVPGRVTPVIASSQTVAASRESLAALSRLVVRGEGGEVTLEALVRDMLRPMLADWLDANLPALVERMVKAEIARIASDAR